MQYISSYIQWNSFSEKGEPNEKGEKMEFSKDDLAEARRQIDSTLHKLRETIKTFESKENAQRYKSQITLAKRRVKAFEIANRLIEREFEK